MATHNEKAADDMIAAAMASGDERLGYWYQPHMRGDMVIAGLKARIIVAKRLNNKEPVGDVVAELVQQLKERR